MVDVPPTPREPRSLPLCHGPWETPGVLATQAILLLFAVLSIPVLLLAKPLMIRSRMKKAEAARGQSLNASQAHLMDGHGSGRGHGKEEEEHDEHGGHDDHDFSEIVIHQVRLCCHGRQMWWRSVGVFHCGDAAKGPG